MALYDPDHKTNLGHALETVVLHCLLQQGAEVGYFLTAHKYAIDFHACMPNGELWLVQVCLDTADRQTLAREIRPFADLSEYERNARKIFVSIYTTQALKCLMMSSYIKPANGC